MYGGPTNVQAPMTPRKPTGHTKSEGRYGWAGAPLAFVPSDQRQ